MIFDLYVNSATVASGTFADNGATRGGAIYVDHGAEISGSFSIDTSIFTHNYASQSGGSLYMVRGSKDQQSANFVHNSTFQSNSADSWGGAIYATTSTALYLNATTFIYNTALNSTEPGDAIACANSTVNVDSSCDFNYGNFSQLITNIGNTCVGNIWTHCACNCTQCVCNFIPFYFCC